MVLCFHTLFFNAPNPFAHGYLSVDVFFILSGFVLAFAFFDKLSGGMSAVSFVMVRVRRLAPVLFLGAVLAAVSGIVTDGVLGSSSSSSSLLLEGVRTLLLIPHVGHGGEDAFPINPPTWSLFAEFWVNVLFALFATRLTRKTLIVIVAMGWLFVAVHSFVNGSADFGDSRSSVDGAILRAMPSFAFGVLLFKLWREGDLRKLPSVHPLVIFGIWIAISMMPRGYFQAPFDIAEIVVIAPVMIALLVGYEGATPSWAVWLGRISYPLYATHAAIVNAGQRLAIAHDHRVTYAIEALVFVLSLLVAWVIATWYEPFAINLLKPRTAVALAPQS
jgi:peptidoglycan/LPS O-acetylase OafA/YrhL